jgi:LPXTG-motif cell wall-anchored protein
VRVIKNAIPNSTQNFSYSTSGGFAPSSFELEDDGDEDDELNSTQEYTFSSPDFDAGGESITEQAQSGWSVDVTCTGDADFSSTDSGRTANLDVDSGEQIVCTFENTADDPGGTLGETRDRLEDEGLLDLAGRNARRLPFTGAQLMSILAIGLALLGSGLALARRRRTG